MEPVRRSETAASAVRYNPRVDLLTECRRRGAWLSLILGVNLGANDPNIAEDWVVAAQSGFRPGQIMGFELGNVTFASALWATDVLFELATAGADGVNFHMGGKYTAFSPGTNGSTAPTVQPLYYGWLLFALAAQNGAALVPTQVESNRNVKIWATLDRSNVLRVVVLNKTMGTDGNVSITIPGLAASGSLLRLTAPALSASSGITIGGQTFDKTIDGKIGGTPITEKVPNVHSVFTFAVHAGSAALLSAQI